MPTHPFLDNEELVNLVLSEPFYSMDAISPIVCLSYMRLKNFGLGLQGAEIIERARRAANI